VNDCVIGTSQELENCVIGATLPHNGAVATEIFITNGAHRRRAPGQRARRRLMPVSSGSREAIT
jgi:hypothetical protein